MKRYISISLGLHLAVLFFVAAMDHPKPEDKVEIEVVENTNPPGGEPDIIELGDGESAQELDTFYWGLGVTGTYKFTEYGYTFIIDSVYSGYSADNAGLQSQDLIILVNGKSPLVEDTKGDGPKDLTLTVMRNNQQLIIKTTRVKVYY